MIRFYDPRDPYGFFSNFSRHPVTIYERTWRTSEHPFQAMKFHPHRPDLVKAVWEAPTPGKAARLGRDRAYPLNPLWEDHDPKMFLSIAEAGQLDLLPDDTVSRPGVLPERCIHRWKDLCMYEVVYAKFTQNGQLQKELLATGDQALVEDAVQDPYWGWGASHVGENKLGRILMTVRDAIRQGIGKPVCLDT